MLIVAGIGHGYAFKITASRQSQYLTQMRLILTCFRITNIIGNHFATQGGDR